MGEEGNKNACDIKAAVGRVQGILGDKRVKQEKGSGAVGRRMTKKGKI